MFVSSCPLVASWPDAWQACLSDFLHHTYESHSRSTKTLDNYRYVLGQFFRAARKPPSDVTPADVRVFIRYRKDGKNASSSYRNNRLGILNAFYKYAARYIPPGSRTPLLEGPLPTLGLDYGREEKRYRALSEVEVERLFAAIPSDTLYGLRDRALFGFYLWTSRRREEILRLRYRDIYKGVVVDEQGHRRESWVYSFVGKGRGQEADIQELPAPAKAALDAYLRASGRLETIEPGDPLFVPINLPGDDTFDEGRALTGSTALRRLKAYAKRAGIDPKRVTIHGLRHTSAQLRYAAGSGIREIQHLLRHTNLATTDKYLTGLMGSADPGAALLAGKFGGF